jgi:CheY-like chemotaxis protein
MLETMSRRKTNKTILVIEDSLTQALCLQTLLEQEGLSVLLAYDGQVGLQMARQSHPDAIVLDLEMPLMNGLQVCQQLQNTRDTADIPIIMLTRHDDHEAVALGLQLGVIEYIPKDAFADAVLLETLRQMGLIAPRAAKT